MLAYLVLSLITGLIFAATGLLGFGAGFWAILMWYIVGCWAGVAGGVAAYLLNGARNSSAVGQWPDRRAIR
jgi:hypothetical protein